MISAVTLWQVTLKTDEKYSTYQVAATTVPFAIRITGQRHGHYDRVTSVMHSGEVLIEDAND